MHLTWTSDFDMEIHGRTPEDIRDLCLRRRYGGLDGLRVRVSGEHLRARYVTGAAAAAPLVKARLLPTITGTRLTGQVHWATLLLYEAMTIGFCLPIGIMCLVFGVAERAWEPLVLGLPLTLWAGWLTVDWLRNAAAVREGNMTLVREALLDAFARH